MQTKTSGSREGKPNGGRRNGLQAKSIRANPFGVLLDGVRRDVDSRLRGFFDSRLDTAKSQGSEVVDLVSAVRDLCLRGGKRLRPALLVAGYRASTASADIEPALDAGVAVELLQAYFLIHDDWMDQDTTRRGGPTVHALLGRRYKSPRTGDAAAILAGDLAVALATEALSRVDVPAKRFPPALAAFAQMQTDAVAGQQLDLLATKNVEKTYELKTGSYTVRGPLLLGALLAGAPAPVLSSLERFALPCGIAFQLRDDLLSAFGDPAQTGKPFGSDIKSGKRTLLITDGFVRARGRDRAILKGAFGNRRAGVRALRAAVDVLESCGARASVERRIDELTEKALGALADGKLSRAGLELLEGAADILAHRRA